MIVITGGAGMIGSMIAWHLNENLGRDDVVVVDRFEHQDQWQNLCHRKLADILDKDELPAWLGKVGKVDAIIHMGAISATTERDFNRLLATNIRYSQGLWNWCAERSVPFLYASSAATYGGGEWGYDDSHDIDALRPLNGYGYSKHYFDQWALRCQREGMPCPPHWYGFKYFNVFGPNEYHKGRMASVAFHTFNQVTEHGRMKLFRSHRNGYADGMQMRDFVYVKDAAKATSHFISTTAPSGLYNIGTGKARAFLDLASAVMRNMDRSPEIDFVDTPEDLRGKYQYFTEANVSKLRAAGYNADFMELEDAVADYVRNYLMQEDPYC
ncbi:ADP-L-glycero-D-manno-heptose 6-epimerase [Rhizobium sp. BK226]|uniref:ADP-glyceromanno-heptose 6-epimerase n=1 Tax=Rhizobium sp. BK226 TaxID=2587075 RepID=UPI00161CFA43|nr:ADP-glyceromanno-heptose 6-epimerase [Rhizobium sp. BK226]MBB4116329.1 ADP-L-glycero-D-manno-heptose 6-epimerase [Rhizobium sp. BK226]